jgi:hypothetical protein
VFKPDPDKAEANAALDALLARLDTECVQIGDTLALLAATRRLRAELLLATRMCLICGRSEPCMTEADLKPGDPGVPCTFDPTPKELWDKLQAAKARIKELETWATIPGHVLRPIVLPHRLSNGNFQGSPEDRATWWTCGACGFHGPFVGKTEQGEKRCLGSCGGVTPNPDCTG